MKQKVSLSPDYHLVRIIESGTYPVSATFPAASTAPQVQAALIQSTQPAAQETQPAPAAGNSYVVNTNTGKFHLPGCRSVAQMKASNRWDYTGSRDWLISQGYEPCKNCNP